MKSASDRNEAEKQEKTVKPSYKRTVVWIRSDPSMNFKPANFEECFFDYWGLKDNTCEAKYTFKDNIVYLEPAQTDTNENMPEENTYTLEHPAFCSVHRLTDNQDLSEKSLARGVDVGVSVIVESSDHHILLTRRAPHMRTFPGVWVPPGGHVEEGETLEEAGIREVFEETGVSLNEYVKNCRVLGLWESCFPPVLYVGLPTRHHLVIYMLLQLNISKNVLDERIKLDYNETDACTWLDEDYIQVVLDRRYTDDSDEVPILAVLPQGEHYPTTTSAKFLRKKMPFPDHEVERITTGTRFALKLWWEQTL